MNWITNYKKEYLYGDISAGITVGVMMIPQGLAYAIIIGIPPIYGLYAGLIPVIIYSFLGSFNKLSVGPVALDSIIVAASVGLVTSVNSEYYLSYVLLLAFMVGLFQIVFGFLKMGFVVNFLSRSVISGFTSAAAILIALSQLKNLFKLDLISTNKIQNFVPDLITKLPDFHFNTLIVGAGSILIMVVFKKVKIKFPGTLAVILLALVLAIVFNVRFTDVEVIGSFPSGIPKFSLPIMDWDVFKSLFGAALALSVIGFTEVISIGKSVEPNTRLNPNKELVAIGTSNLLGSLFSSFTISGSFSRSAVSKQSGANTSLAGLISALLIGITLLFLTSYFQNLPKTVIAAIIIVSVLSLVKVKEPFRLWKINKIDFITHIITFVITLTIGITEGLLIGVLLSLLLLTYQTSKPHIAELGKIPNTQFYRNIARFQNLESSKEILIVRFDSPIYFANASFFEEKMNDLVQEKGKGLKRIIINMESVFGIDSTGMYMMDEWVRAMDERGVEVFFTSVIGPLRDIFEKYNKSDWNCNRSFLSIENAINYNNSQSERMWSSYVSQSNKPK